MKYCVPSDHVVVLLKDGNQVKIYYSNGMVNVKMVDEEVGELVLSSVLGYRSVAIFTPKIVMVAMCKKIREDEESYE